MESLVNLSGVGARPSRQFKTTICLIPCEIYKEEKDKIYGFAWATTNAANDFDYRVLEIITSVRLREVLQLNTGSVVTTDIPVSWKG